MSFNIRLGVANDGKNRWDLRKIWLLIRLRNFVRLIGSTGSFSYAGRILRKNLPEYLYYGRSRLVDPRDGEACRL